jgi:ATP-dependent Clp protease protease subunit
MHDRLAPHLSVQSDDPDEPDRAPDSETPKASPPNNEVEDRLFKLRKVLIFGEINDKLARDVTARLLTLAGDAEAPIDVFVNSPGGHVESGDSIHDVIRFVRDSAPVRIIGTGWVASIAAHIFLAAPRERRYCLPNTRFLLHQPMGGVRGPATDIGIEANEIIKTRKRINKVIAAETGQPLDKVALDTDRNYWMSPEEAIAYGMVGKIITSPKELD